jgi:uncharacterized repeat protein (TIGR02543 family)
MNNTWTKIAKINNMVVYKYLSAILLAIIFSNSVVAQYTLQDDDVVINNGVIESCSYNYEETDIIIPEVLQGQTVLEIADGTTAFSGGAAFSYKGITSVQLPSTLEYIGKYAFRNNSITHLDLSNCTNLKQIVSESFVSNTMSSIDFSGCENLIYIGNNVFRVNYLTSVDFTGCNKLSIISLNAFSDNSFSSVDLSPCKSLTLINYGAFYGNAGLSGLELPTPEIPGYKLDYWLCSSEDVFAGGDYITNLGLSYEAMLSLATYDITYNTNGGTHSNMLEYTMDDTPLTFNDAKKAGYLFLGWYDNAEFTGEVITELTEGTYGNIELWANLSEAYTLTYNADGGSHENPSEYATEGTPLTLLAATKEGYDFMGWYANAEFTGDAITEIAEGTSGDLEFWAKFEVSIGVSSAISSELTIYPNPVKHQFVITNNQIEIESISLFSMNGELLFYEIPSSTEQTSVNMINYKNGLYYVSIKTKKGQTQTNKIIKTN